MYASVTHCNQTFRIISVVQCRATQEEVAWVTRGKKLISFNNKALEIQTKVSFVMTMEIQAKWNWKGVQLFSPTASGLAGLFVQERQTFRRSNTVISPQKVSAVIPKSIDKEEKRRGERWPSQSERGRRKWPLWVHIVYVPIFQTSLFFNHTYFACLHLVPLK